jgi:hypothetical protein
LLLCKLHVNCALYREEAQLGDVLVRDRYQELVVGVSREGGLCVFDSETQRVGLYGEFVHGVVHVFLWGEETGFFGECGIESVSRGPETYGHDDGKKEEWVLCVELEKWDFGDLFLLFLVGFLSFALFSV